MNEDKLGIFDMPVRILSEETYKQLKLKEALLGELFYKGVENWEHFEIAFEAYKEQNNLDI